MKKLDEVLGMLPDNVYLHCVDYRDSLDEQTNTIQKCLSEKSMDSLYEKIDDWFLDDFYGFDAVLEDLKEGIEDSGEDWGEVWGEYEDEIRDAIYERDCSDVLGDLLANTSDMVFFAETGLEFSGYGQTPAEYRLERILLKKFFNIKDSAQDDTIDMMILQAGYGGSLRIYFNENAKDILGAIENKKSISFNGSICVAIVDSGNGSGDHCEIIGSCVVPLEVFLCKEVRYSYTYDVCGMYSDWCSSTQFQYSDDCFDEKESKTREYVERENELNKVFNLGKCTPGDMKFERHRNTHYINDFPCGTRCEDCGTFWID